MFGLAKKLTAGRIAKKFIELVDERASSSMRAELARDALEFDTLVTRRNEILHGKPCTGEDGKPALFGGNRFWPVSDLDVAADAASALSISLGALRERMSQGPL
jgi:hypothetical protein